MVGCYTHKRIKGIFAKTFSGHVPMFDQTKEFDAALLAFPAGELVGE